MSKPILIIMGVSGAGKTTLGKALAQAMAIPFFDADDYHPTANVEKMNAGIALEDEDRWPWLEKLSQLLQEQTTEGAILACSALKSSYRSVLASTLVEPPILIWLHGSREVLTERLTKRQGHFMPASLLQSQIDTLELPGKTAFIVDIALPTSEQITLVMDHLGQIGKH